LEVKSQKKLNELVSGVFPSQQWSETRQIADTKRKHPANSAEMTAF